MTKAHPGNDAKAIPTTNISNANNNKQPPNIFPSYLHLYYMKSKSKNQPKSKNNF
jgi:hypothetical protein